MHPILESLVGTEREWLKNLLFAFNSGDIGKFEALAPHFAHEVNKRSVWQCHGGLDMTAAIKSVFFLTLYDYSFRISCSPT